MGRLSRMKQFANASDFRRALADPRKAARVLLAILRDTGSERERLDEAESRRRRTRFLTDNFDTDADELAEYAEDLAEGAIPARIERAEAFFEEKPYDLGGMRFNGETLYLLTRLLEPETVLEIGVANGMSTAYLLGGLEDARVDGQTDVYAIDRPLFASTMRERRGTAGLTSGLVPDEKEAGWIAPRSLRHEYGHQYYAGDFTKILDPILDDIGEVDLVVYDASKDRQEMRMAYERCLDSLSPGGVLLSDDILVNDAFEDVTDAHAGRAEVIHNAGVFVSNGGR